MIIILRLKNAFIKKMMTKRKIEKKQNNFISLKILMNFKKEKSKILEVMKDCQKLIINSFQIKKRIIIIRIMKLVMRKRMERFKTVIVKKGKTLWSLLLREPTVLEGLL